MSRLFISQKRLDSWLEQERITIEDRVMTLANGQRFELSPAVFVSELVGSKVDPNEIVGKVKTRKQLEEMAAEHVHDSLIMGEVGYQVVEGFVGLRLG